MDYHYSSIIEKQSIDNKAKRIHACSSVVKVSNGKLLHNILFFPAPYDTIGCLGMNTAHIQNILLQKLHDAFLT